MRCRPRIPRRSLFALAAAVALALASPLACAADEATWYVSGSRVLPAPDAAALIDAVVLGRGSKILAVGPKAELALPTGARELGCGGGVVTAGFQNSHVHFTGPQFAGAARAAPAALEAALREMLTRHGVTTAVDTSSDRDNTLALRARIDSGALAGPRILTVGAALFPAGGIPFYLDFLPQAVRDALPQPATPEAATQLVRANLAAGADATKLFIATPQADRSVKHMPVPVARAAADETHRAGKLALAHPTDVDGLRDALAAGVDVLLHTTLGVVEPWPEALVTQLVVRKTALVPTLKLWPYELDKARLPDAVRQRLIDATLAQLKQYADAGGLVLFGTDVGYMADFDPADEYLLMARAGLSAMQILASLTTAPAQRWGEADRGRVAAGQQADLVVLDGDPAVDVRQFGKVRCTIRGGALIYRR